MGAPPGVIGLMEGVAPLVRGRSQRPPCAVPRRIGVIGDHPDGPRHGEYWRIFTPPPTPPRQAALARPVATATQPPPTPTPSRADVEADFPPPGTGALLAPRKGGKGLGELTVSNGTASDAIVKLSREGEATAVVFVHAADETTVTGIAPGTYDIQFSLGIGYDPETRRFVRNDGFQEFDEPTTYTEVRDARGTSYSVLRVTLNPVVGGNARTEAIDEDAFAAGW